MEVGFFLLKILGGGGFPGDGGGVGEGPRGCLRGIWGRGRANFFFFPGRNSHQDLFRQVLLDRYFLD